MNFNDEFSRQPHENWQHMMERSIDKTHLNTSGKPVMRTFLFWLSLILIFMIPWADMIDIGHPLTVIRITGFLLFVFWLLNVITTDRFRKPHPFHIAFYLFLFWNILSAFWSFNIERTVERILIYFQLAILVWILWDLCQTQREFEAWLQAYILGAYVAIGGIVANYIMGNEATLGSFSRYSAAGLDANDLGLTLAIGIPIAWHLAESESDRKKIMVLKLVNYAYIPAAILAILLTASRGALIATFPAILYILGSLTRIKVFSRILISTAFVGTLFAILPLIPQSSIQRLATIGTSISELEIGGRGEIWRQGIDLFFEHPLLGVGSGAFRSVVKANAAAHNTFLSVLVEVGIIGFILFVIILAIIVYQAIQQPKWGRRLWLSVLLVWAIGASSLTWERVNATWLILSLVVISSSQYFSKGLSGLSSEPSIKLKKISDSLDNPHDGEDHADSSHTLGRVEHFWESENEKPT